MVDPYCQEYGLNIGVIARNGFQCHGFRFQNELFFSIKDRNRPIRHCIA